MAHKATFVMKLKAFFQDCKEDLKIDDKKCEQLAKIMQSTRNHYTHLLKTKKNVLKEEYLSMVNNILFSLIVKRLLKYFNNEIEVSARYSFLTLISKNFISLINTNIEKMLIEK